MGGPNNRPSLLHWFGSFERTSSYVERSSPDFLPKYCQQFFGWNGNGPLVQFAEKLWLGIVHKWQPVPKTDGDAIGRNYSNIPSLFESNTAYGSPTRCYRRRIIAEGQYVMEADPAFGWNMPFAFIMGLVHLGKISDHYEGSVHKFLLSAGLDDFMPVLSLVVFVVSLLGAGCEATRSRTTARGPGNSRVEKIPRRVGRCGEPKRTLS